MKPLRLFLAVAGTWALACGSGTDAPPASTGHNGGTTSSPNTGGAAPLAGSGGTMPAGGSGATGQGGSGATPQGGSGGSAQAGTDSSSGGTGATFATQCGLPAAGAPGVARPSGTADGLVVLDWAGFEAAVSYTFDDSNSSQIQHYDELNALGVPMTFYLLTSKPESTDPIWKKALTDGHELGNHSATHPQTGTAADVDSATEFIVDEFGVTPFTMAAPYGDASYVPIAEGRFLINRGVVGGSIAPGNNANRFNLPSYVPPEGAAAAAMNMVTDSARAAGNWQIVLLHGFIGGSDYAYQPVALDAFVSSVQHAKAHGDIWLDTVLRVGAYWIAQELLSSATPQVSADQTTWSWTLPDHFPPGMCLRVRADGGTLLQAGQPLAWDDHGYYEVSLDAGALTLVP